MRVVHHTIGNGSGLNRVAVNMATAEKRLGLDSVLTYTDSPETSIKVAPDVQGAEVVTGADAAISDIHVVHSHLPDECKGKSVFIPHGTPEHCFAQAIDQSRVSGFWAGDPFMLSLYRANNSDVTVTFWERHRYIWQSLCPKVDVRVIPMGIDTEFWKPVESAGKLSGEPSLFTCENPHSIKWPLDLILAFPILMEKTKAVLHAHYLPMDQARFWYPLLQANGTSYRSFSSSTYMDHASLRNSFASSDYYLNLVRYGDFNSVGLEAKATGCKVISYRGNPYSDFWLTEGDQRVMAQELIDIFEGKTEPNRTDDIVSIDAMAKNMKEIYEAL
jgi:glycosyltransferase involved in cell wall biosynthesis